MPGVRIVNTDTLVMTVVVTQIMLQLMQSHGIALTNKMSVNGRMLKNSLTRYYGQTYCNITYALITAVIQVADL